MATQKLKLSDEVTKFLDNLDHPLRDEIEQLRKDILAVDDKLTETIKWNGPNFCFEGEDRITMRVHPPKLIQLIFHRGAKVQKQPENRLINDKSGLLKWKTNDRAVAEFKNMDSIISNRSDLNNIVNEWLKATVNIA